MATSWFQRATAVFGKPEPIPQRFDVSCDCGACLHGVRAPVPQKPTCPDCGCVVFILPETIYPIPPSIQRRWTGGDDDLAAPTEPKKSKKSSRTGKKKPALEAVTKSPSVPKGPSLGDQTRDLATRVRAAATPVRLVAVGIVFGLLVTMGVVYRQYRWDHAQRVLQGAIDRGKAAVEQREFAQASEAYAVAASALDILGRRDEASRAIRRTARESHAAANLLEKPLIEILATWLSSKPEGASLESAAGRSWILFDAPLMPFSDDENSQKLLMVDLPLRIEEMPIRLFIEGRTWSALTAGATPELPKRVIFAAQIERGERPTSGRREARVWLDDTSAVLWTDEAIYSGLNLIPEDEVSRKALESVFAAQRDHLEAQR